MNINNILKIYAITTKENKLPEKFSGVICDIDKTVIYFRNGVYHKEKGPAIKFVNGTKHWFIDGYRHRTSGPAIEYYNNEKLWYENELLHREDGPAIEYADGNKVWAIEGVIYSEENFNKQIKSINRNKWISKIFSKLGYC